MCLSRFGSFSGFGSLDGPTVSKTHQGSPVLGWAFSLVQKKQAIWEYEHWTKQLWCESTLKAVFNRSLHMLSLPHSNSSLACKTFKHTNRMVMWITVFYPCLWNKRRLIIFIMVFFCEFLPSPLLSLSLYPSTGITDLIAVHWPYWTAHLLYW